MKSDPRHRNHTFSNKNPSQYLAEYSAAVAKALSEVSPLALTQAVDLLEQTARAGHTIYVCGNGGSAAIADHLTCDWTKGSTVDGVSTPKVVSLTGSTALFSAIANDYGYAETFSTQIEMFAQEGDVLIAISSSGSSPNIINAVTSAQKKRLRVVGLSGFTGGELAQRADISLYIGVHNYGVVEDCHQTLMHVISQFFVARLNPTT